MAAPGSSPRAAQRQRRKEMPAASGFSLDRRVRLFVADWEQKVSQELTASRMMLVMGSRTARERAHLKQRVQTLSAVLDLLQGKNTRDTWDSAQLREEVASLRVKLRAARAKQREALGRLATERKISRDLKGELEKSHRRQAHLHLAAQDVQQEHCWQLKEVQADFVARLSVEAAKNHHLRAKLAQLKLAQLQDGAVSAGVEQGSDPTHLQSPSTCEEGDKGDSGLRAGNAKQDEDTMIHLEAGQLQELLKDSCRQVWGEQAAAIRSQRRRIGKLQAAVSHAKEQLGVLQAREEEWRRKAEEVEEAGGRSKSRNWFARMFR